MALQFSGPIANLRSNRIGVGFLTNQAHAEPMVLSSRVIAKENRRAVVDRDEYIDRSIIIEVPDCEPSRRKSFGENRAAFEAYILPRFSIIMEDEHRLGVSHVGNAAADHCVRMTIAEEEIEIAIIVVVNELDSPAA